MTEYRRREVKSTVNLIWKAKLATCFLTSVILSFCEANPVTALARRSMAVEDQPENFRYIHLWVSADGESHIKECNMSGFKIQAYSSAPQYVRDEFGGQPLKIVFTELFVGLQAPLHSAPQVQFVATLAGSWYIKTTDGAEYVFQPGEVLFQDNTNSTSAQKPGQHYSGVAGDVPCQQMIIQFNRPPDVDNPCTF